MLHGSPQRKGWKHNGPARDRQVGGRLVCCSVGPVTYLKHAPFLLRFEGFTLCTGNSGAAARFATAMACIAPTQQQSSSGSIKVADNMGSSKRYH